MQNSEKNNIVLIVMPGVGKSTLGVILAKIIGYRFLDADLVIQEREGMLLKEIIAKKGVEGFMAIENEVNASLKCEKTIIATGGSVIYGREAMEHLKKIGKVIYLKAEYETLNKRLSNLQGRGVVLKHGQNLQQLYDERTPLYEEYADYIIDETGCDIEETIKKILQKLEEN